MNIGEIEAELAELVKEGFDSSDFAFRLLAIFNAPKATLAKLRSSSKGNGEEIVWKRKIHFKLVRTGAADGALNDLAAANQRSRARLIVVTDGAEFVGIDTKTAERVRFNFAELNDHFDFFLPLAGIERYAAVEENPADIKAAGRLATFYDEILRANPEWRTDNHRHALNQFMTRLLFCFFAEDTGSFPREIFTRAISEFGGEEGEGLQLLLTELFHALDVAEAERNGLPAHLRLFPYVNGGLFAERPPVPLFSARAKRLLLDAAQMNWAEINPDIFGSMIQAVVDPTLRSDLGMHYTSVPNIMKVLQPLLLLSLEEELEAAGDDARKLTKFLERLGRIRIFDPACGSGNFLIIAYRELRKLEMRAFQRLHSGKMQFDIPFSSVRLGNFFGLEIADFAVETAKLSLWIAEYQMNQQFRDLFKAAPPDFPLQDGGSIVLGNALLREWTDICPPAGAGEAETYIVGNPPYLGGKRQDKRQKADLATAFERLRVNTKNLDYVAGWFARARDYALRVPNVRFAFVATNSINQGVQVPTLWPAVLGDQFEIGFAFRNIKWSNSAAQKANVTCSIVGVRRNTRAPKYLFTEGNRVTADNINAYLLPAPNLIVEKRSQPLSALPRMYHGNTALDDSQLLLTRKTKDAIASEHPEVAHLFKRVVGSKEFINNIERWCLWIDEAELPLAKSVPAIAERIAKVHASRLRGGATAQSCADRPHQFFLRRLSQASYLVVPAVSSERRTYLPAGFSDADTIITHLAYMVLDPPPFLLAVLCSKMHLLWMQTMGGRLRSDFRYSTGVVYNTFPLPKLSDDEKGELEALAWDIVAARDAHPGKTIGWLYDPQNMPANLREVHASLDGVLERIYVGREFKNDTERLEHLIKLYARMTASRKEAVDA